MCRERLGKYSPTPFEDDEEFSELVKILESSKYGERKNTYNSS
jgi:hypothetical protein